MCVRNRKQIETIAIVRARGRTMVSYGYRLTGRYRYGESSTIFQLFISQIKNKYCNRTKRTNFRGKFSTNSVYPPWTHRHDLRQYFSVFFSGLARNKVYEYDSYEH